MVAPNPQFDQITQRSPGRRRALNSSFKSVCVVIAAASVLILIVLLGSIVSQGYHVIGWRFLTSPPASDAETSGIGPALLGTIWVCGICSLLALPLGVGTALFLEEYKPTHVWMKRFHSFVQLNISNLAGVPSIVYGLLGLTAFASMFGLFGKAQEPMFELGATHTRQYITEGLQIVFIDVPNRSEIPELVDGLIVRSGTGERVPLNIIDEGDEFPGDEATLAYSLYPDAEGGIVTRKRWYYFRLPFGRSVLAAGLTLMLVILPVIIIASQESLRAVPSSLREGAMGLGATRWQVIRNVTLPAAVPGIMTGSILSTSRAIGEAAPIVILAGLVYIKAGPSHLMDDYSVLPLQIFYWAGQPIKEQAEVNYQHIAAGGSIVLLMILLTFNAIAIAIRQWMHKPLS